MSKTPEEMAEEFSNVFRSERKKTIAKKSWYTGFEEGLKYTSAKWISVKDRLPEGGQVVLVIMPKGTVTLGGIRKKTQTWDVFLDVAIWTAEPTHWMPLPEPPKEEK